MNEIDSSTAVKIMGWRDLGSGRAWETEHGEIRYWDDAHRFFRPSTDIRSAWEVRAVIQRWLYSKRQAFKKELQRAVSTRRMKSGELYSQDEILLYVDAIDICVAGLAVVDKFPGTRPVKDLATLADFGPWMDENTDSI